MSEDIKANLLAVSRVFGSRRRTDGGSHLAVEFPSGQRVMLEFSPEDAPQVLFAGIRGLPAAPLIKGISTDWPVFQVDDFAIGNSVVGDTALIVDMTGAGQLGLKITPELGKSLRDALDIWLSDLESRPETPLA